MYHIVPEVRFSIHITVHGVCHGVVRLVSSNGYMFTLGLSRCREVGFIQMLYIISMAVRSGLPDGVLLLLLPRHLSMLRVVRWVSHGIWYDTSLVLLLLPRHLSMLRVVRWVSHGIWYDTSLVYGMVHRWYMVWYIVSIWYVTSLVYGMVHRWYMV